MWPADSATHVRAPGRASAAQRCSAAGVLRGSAQPGRIPTAHSITHSPPALPESGPRPGPGARDVSPLRQAAFTIALAVQCTGRRRAACSLSVTRSTRTVVLAQCCNWGPQVQVPKEQLGVLAAGRWTSSRGLLPCGGTSPGGQREARSRSPSLLSSSVARVCLQCKGHTVTYIQYTEIDTLPTSVFVPAWKVNGSSHLARLNCDPRILLA